MREKNKNWENTYISKYRQNIFIKHMYVLGID